MALVSVFFLALSFSWPPPSPYLFPLCSLFLHNVLQLRLLHITEVWSVLRGKVCVSLPEPPVSLPACFPACRFTSYTAQPWAQERGLSPNFNRALFLCLFSMSCKLLSVRWVTFCNLCCQIWLDSVENGWRDCRMDGYEHISSFSRLKINHNKS